MKRIDAIIRIQNLEPVKDQLLAIGVEGLTVAAVQGFGRQKGREVYRGAEYVVEFLTKLLLTTTVRLSDSHIDVTACNAAA
jgi:nitrogen regulatory protein PII